MFGTDFYPTPETLCAKMANKIDWKKVRTMLEPSAGSGNLVEYFSDRYRAYQHRTWQSDLRIDCDCCEISPELQSVLRGKGWRVVHDDFLTFNTYKRYDLIAMNPPFSNGAKHLLHALRLMRHGGQIVCILNAETIRNPYTNERRALCAQLDKLGATLEYSENEFSHADRTSDVEIAMIYVDVPCDEQSDILANLKKKWVRRSNADDQAPQDEVAKSNIYESLVDAYNFEVAAGTKLIDEFHALSPKLKTDLPTNDNNEYSGYEILSLTIGSRHRDATVNDFIKATRKKYWSAIMQTEKLSRLMTKEIREEYMSKLDELVEYDVSMPNIYQMFIDLTAQFTTGLEGAIVKLFEDFTYRYSYSTEGNVHYFNGWKTNKAYVVNKKVILPYMNAFSDLWHRWEFRYSIEETLKEIEKVFVYLDTKKTDGPDLHQALLYAENEQISRGIELKYFTVTFYKKGTCHIEFTDPDLLQKFNLFGCQRKGWLPPSFGKKGYTEMNQEEQTVVDEFCGKDEYALILDQKDFYLAPITGPLMIEQGA